MKGIPLIIAGAVFLAAGTTGCECQLNPGNARTLASVATHPGFTRSSFESWRGTKVTLSVPSGWAAVPSGGGTHFARRDESTPRPWTNVSVVVQPSNGQDLLERAEGHKCAMGETGWDTSEERKVTLDDRDLYELVYRGGGTPQLVMIELIEIAGDEVVFVRCTMDANRFPTTRALCDDIFSTVTVEAP